MKNNTIDEFSEIFNKYRNLSNYAFSLYLFIVKVNEECKKNNITDLFFLAREGAFLKRLFDIYNNKNEHKVKTHYMYISRKAAVNATLKELSKESFDAFNAYKDISISQFLHGLNFSNSEIEVVMSSNENFTDETYANFFSSEVFSALKKSPVFAEIYELKRQTSHMNLKKYLTRIGFDSCLNVAVVDVGWNGTIQDALFKMGLRKIIFGFYIGTTAKGSNNNFKRGLLFENNSLTDSFCCSRYNFEYICVAEHGSTDYYDNEGNPVLFPDEDNVLFSNYFKKIQDDIFEKFKKIDFIARQKDLSRLEFIVRFFHSRMLVFMKQPERMILKSTKKRKPDNFIDKNAKQNIKNYAYSLLQYIIIFVSLPYYYAKI